MAEESNSKKVITIELDGELADQIRALTDAYGETVDEYVRRTLQARLDDWDEDLRRLEEPGENVPIEEAFDRFTAKLIARGGDEPAK